MKAMIYGNGGGSAKVFAVIGVTYPEGSTCTATDGTTTLTAPDTSGSWLCVVPKAGEWTAECTDGTDTVTETVTISAEGQVETVEIGYGIYIIKNGIIQSDYSYVIERGHSTTDQPTITNVDDYLNVDMPTGRIAISFSPAIDTTQFTKFIIEASHEYKSSDSQWLQQGLATSTTWVDNESTYWVCLNEESDYDKQQITFDLSNVSQTLYYKINGYSGYNMKIYNVKFIK